MLTKSDDFVLKWVKEKSILPSKAKLVLQNFENRDAMLSLPTRSRFGEGRRGKYAKTKAEPQSGSTSMSK